MKGGYPTLYADTSDFMCYFFNLYKLYIYTLQPHHK